jgi:hypothetical protein
MAKKNPSVTSLRAGQTVYYIHALGKSSFMTTHVVTGFVYLHKSTNSFFCPAKHILHCKSHRDTCWFNDDFSLRDSNCSEQNGYNSHRLFYSRKKALRYLESCLTTPDKYEYHPTRGEGFMFSYNDIN